MTGKTVEWKATFDRPLEQLIYPSLQIVEKDFKDKKKEMYAAYDMNENDNDVPDVESTLDYDKPVHTLMWSADITDTRSLRKARLASSTATDLIDPDKPNIPQYSSFLEEIEVSTYDLQP